jgi:hypothetical protein
MLQATWLNAYVAAADPPVFIMQKLRIGAEGILIMCR